MTAPVVEPHRRWTAELRWLPAVERDAVADGAGNPWLKRELKTSNTLQYQYSQIGNVHRANPNEIDKKESARAETKVSARAAGEWRRTSHPSERRSRDRSYENHISYGASLSGEDNSEPSSDSRISNSR